MSPAMRDAIATARGAQDYGAAQAWTLLALSTLPVMAIASLVPVLPSLFAHFSSVPDRELLVPMVLTVPSLCVALFSSPIGVAADRWGRRRLLLVALAAFSVAGLLPMAFDDLHAIIASRVVVGVAEATLLTVGNALMGDYFQGAQRRRWLGLQMSTGAFFSSMYIVAGGVLGSWNWRGPFLLYLVGLLVLAAAIRYLPEPARRPGGEAGIEARHADGGAAVRVGGDASGDAGRHFPWRVTGQICAVTLLVSIIYFVQAVQHGRIFSDLGVEVPSRIGLIVTLASGGTIIGGMVFKRLPPTPVSTLLAVSFLAYGVSYLGIGLSPDYRVGLPFDAIGQFGGGFVLPTLIAWALSQYDFEHRGRGMGIWGGCFFLGQFLSPPVLTLVAHGRLSFLQTVAVLGGGCLVLAAAALLLRWRRR
ncbi:MAG: MFS transporter [Steroidobacteraceae bacterium]